MKKIILGLSLIYIGVISLLNNLGYISFHWLNIFRLWPVILLFAGINILLRNKKNDMISIIKLIIFSIVLIIATYIGLKPYQSNNSHFYWEFNDDRFNAL